MIGYLVDPVTKGVEVVCLEAGIDGIYKMLGCSCFAVGWTSPKGDTLYVDDEGLLVAGNRSFNVCGYPQPLFGRGLLLGCNSCTGDTLSQPVSGFTEFINMVHFVPQFVVSQ